jgi:hypothetical protein
MAKILFCHNFSNLFMAIEDTQEYSYAVMNNTPITLSQLKRAAALTSLVLIYIRGAKSWFDKEELTPEDIVDKANEGHPEYGGVTKEEVTVIIWELFGFIALRTDGKGHGKGEIKGVSFSLSL